MLQAGSSWRALPSLELRPLVGVRMTECPPPAAFAATLAAIYSDSHAAAGMNTGCLASTRPRRRRSDVLDFSAAELANAIEQLRSNKSADPQGLVVEMLKHGKTQLLLILTSQSST
jgi:hypothetical protein